MRAAQDDDVMSERVLGFANFYFLGYIKLLKHTSDQQLIAENYDRFTIYFRFVYVRWAWALLLLGFIRLVESHEDTYMMVGYLRYW